MRVPSLYHDFTQEGMLAARQYQLKGSYFLNLVLACLNCGKEGAGRVHMILYQFQTLSFSYFVIHGTRDTFAMGVGKSVSFCSCD